MVILLTIWENYLFFVLQDKIEREQFEYTIKMMNNMYQEAGKANCSTFCEGCMACMVEHMNLNFSRMKDVLILRKHYF